MKPFSSWAKYFWYQLIAEIGRKRSLIRDDSFPVFLKSGDAKLSVWMTTLFLFYLCFSWYFGIVWKKRQYEERTKNIVMKEWRKRADD